MFHILFCTCLQTIRHLDTVVPISDGFFTRGAPEGRLAPPYSIYICVTLHWIRENKIILHWWTLHTVRRIYIQIQIFHWFHQMYMVLSTHRTHIEQHYIQIFTQRREREKKINYMLIIYLYSYSNMNHYKPYVIFMGDRGRGNHEFTIIFFLNHESALCLMSP